MSDFDHLFRRAATRMAADLERQGVDTSMPLDAGVPASRRQLEPLVLTQAGGAPSLTCARIGVWATIARLLRRLARSQRAPEATTPPLPTEQHEQNRDAA